MGSGPSEVPHEVPREFPRGPGTFVVPAVMDPSQEPCGGFVFPAP